MGGSRHFGFRALKAHRSPWTSRPHRASPRSRKRTFSERYLRVIKLRKLDSIRRYRNEASMLGVLYPYAKGIPFCKRAYMVYIHYNTRWRGLAELLISMERQCEGLMTGMSKKVSPTSFLCPYVDRIHNRSIDN